jgi:hypothetical protein
MVGIVLITALMKITSVALIVPVLVWWYWSKPKLVLIAALGSVIGLLCIYFMSPTAQEHVSLNTIQNQYVAQGAIMLGAGLLIFWLQSWRAVEGIRHLLIILVVFCSTYYLEHRLLFAVVLGILLGVLLGFNRERWSSEFFRKIVFVVLAILLNFLGSDTGFYKSSMLLPLLVFIGVPLKTRLSYSALLLCLALPLLIFKPIRFNPGGYEIGAVLFKSIWDADFRDDYEWINIEGHGDFLVMKWLSMSIDRADFLVDSLGTEHVTFKGPHSTFFNSRYGKSYHLSYLGPRESDISTAYVFGRGISESRYGIVEEVHAGFNLYELKGADVQ